MTEYGQEDDKGEFDPLEESKEDMRGFKENRSYRGFDEQTERSAYNKPKNAEDLVVPAHGMKKPIDFNTVGDEDFDGGPAGQEEDELTM